MVMDALRGYVQLANGLTEVTRQRAQQAAKALLQQSGAESLTTRVSDLADEIVATSKSNRQLLQAIVANEVEGAVARLGFARVEEVAALSRRIQKLEGEVAEAHAAAADPSAPAAPAPAKRAAKDTAPAKASPTQNSAPTANNSPTADTSPAQASAPTSPAKTSAAKERVPATKAAAKKSAPAKKAAKQSAPAKKAAAKKAAKKAPAKKA
ncbi:MAG TPA: polyhydroxyalkanoate synthesis protein PhaF [Kribbella sp.]|jgi:polyhydroxyalkanoate synthesis regulator phasin